MTREYPTVLSRSVYRLDLEEAHRTVISEEAARKIIFVYLDEGEVRDIRFSCRTARGWCSYHRTSVTLKFHPREHLTLGIVLHEIAHALNWLDGGKRGHGDKFVEILDGLLRSELEEAI
jgi:hypothetical protein